MEVVLSPGNLGGDSADGAPFRNEDVREWSRVDRITGMLERARVETGRWRANTRDAAHSYGKMVDSRERNSADGSLVQRARRQVEIFQSQGTGGRSFQVVRASQWSSSRAKDTGIFDVPSSSSISSTEQQPAVVAGSPPVTNGEATSLASRLSLWRSSFHDKASDLERLSSLCRKLHDEALSQSTNFWSLRSGSRSPSPLPPPMAQNGHREPPSDDNTSDASSNKSSLLLATERRSNSTEDLSSDAFARDCRTRRSLQVGPDNSPEPTASTDKLVAERARKFEEAARRRATGESPSTGKPRRFARQFASIADNDFVKNDPKHPSKQPTAHKEPGAGRNNKTVVHLRSAASPDRSESNDTREPEYSMLVDASSAPVLANGKPVKRVEFCKTEIHFAPDSGKVNIVETDGKPPPTNKFRRRRRNNNAPPMANGALQKSDLPLVHFGDTSYEKFIFGKPPATRDDSSAVVDAEGGCKSHEPVAQRWASPGASREDHATEERVGDRRHPQKGAHTTTVNFLGSENAGGALMPSIGQDKPSNVYPSIDVASKEIGRQEQVISKDSDNNQVLLKIVTTHKPTLARVENDHQPVRPLRSRSMAKSLGSDEVDVPSANEEAKDPHYDSVSVGAIPNGTTSDAGKDNSDGKDAQPTYENVFDTVGTPVYENFQVTRGADKLVKRMNKSSAVEKTPVGPAAHDKKHRRLSSRASGDSTDRASSKNVKAKGSTRPETPVSTTRSLRSNGSRESSVRKVKEAKPVKEDGSRSAQARRKTGSKEPSAQASERKGVEKNGGGSVRSKKTPVEVVYQTAVYNIKNENLNKPKVKEVKGPRLINDLICGSKTKRPSDKKPIKTNVSQNTSKRKEMPTVTKSTLVFVSDS
ncbi:uncharacterized protein LOC106643413 isoform X2 [Copidosoma floridanum]|uniref:uncharacterized protein LOC106643413 isoform X2 n=1 Tax=Copidosoma floridanum TaxID=29053 RepID=UPI0006C9A7AF|nr:uncharacterized protein LOC106643413 isoform X2 [Copidosoma floridanum]